MATNELVKSGIGALVGLVIAVMIQQSIDDNSSTFTGISSTVVDFLVPLYILGVLAAIVVSKLY